MGFWMIILNDIVAVGLGILICKVEPDLVVPRYKRKRYKLPERGANRD